MAVWFYADDSTISPFKLYVPGDTVADIQVYAGRYHLIAYPAESEVMREASASLPHEHSLYTRTASASEKLFGANSAPSDLILEPETTWVASDATVEVTDSDDQMIVLYPADPMCYYTLEVRNLYFDNTPAAISGALTSLARGLYPATLERHTQTASIAFSCSHDKSDATIHAEFITFGVHPDTPTPNLLHFYVKDSAANIYSITDTDAANFDLSDQVRNAPDPHHVHLILDFNGQTINISPEQTGSQLGAQGSEYREVNEDITI